MASVDDRRKYVLRPPTLHKHWGGVGTPAHKRAIVDGFRHLHFRGSRGNHDTSRQRDQEKIWTRHTNGLQKSKTYYEFVFECIRTIVYTPILFSNQLFSIFQTKDIIAREHLLPPNSPR